MVKILIIDAQRSVRNILREKLEFEGYTTEAVDCLEEAVIVFEKLPFDIVLCDKSHFDAYINSPNREGSFPGRSRVIVLCDSPSTESVVHAMRSGAYDFVKKPVDMNYLLGAIKRASDELDNLREAVTAGIQPAGRAKLRKSCRVEEIIGESSKISHVKTLIDKVAPSDARVLITGPNGTGKELVARWLHEKSPRSDAPFVEVNCAAIPSELIESELFGHEKGAFTSAIKQRKGKFEQANGGTLFLDEIGDMSLSAQAKVLRALQESRICRVGSDRDVMVDVRVIAATNKNLREEIKNGNFREDLYHRLSVIVIQVPPLVDRLEDIPLLVDYFVEKICGEYDIAPKHVDQKAIEELKTMDWSGNIRELRNVVERLIILSGEEITPLDVKTYALGLA